MAAAGKSKKISWSQQCQEAFDQSKAALGRATLLHHPDPMAATALTVDALDVAVGAKLAQWRGSQWVPIAFYSKKLQPPQLKYSAFNRELLVIFLSTKCFRHFLKGRKFTIFTDQMPLTFAMASTTDRLPRQTRHLSYC